jgi:hypothetical protein
MASVVIESGAFTAAPFEFDHFAYRLRLVLDSIEVQANHQMTDRHNRSNCRCSFL